MNIQEIIKKKREMYKYFTESEALEAVKNGGDALQYVAVQTEAICLEAVKNYGYALRYFKEHLFIEEKELTVQQISDLLGYNVKIVK
jgi:hypothetical protein